MRKTARLLCLLMLLGLPGTPALAQERAKRLNAHVTKVYDGASFQLGGGLRAALIGVAAPAPGAPGAAQARAVLKRLLENRVVGLEIDKKPVDEYGQPLYYVFLKDGAHVNVLMVLRGLGRALVKHPNVRYRRQLIEAESIAKAYRRGVWGEFDPPREPERPFNRW